MLPYNLVSTTAKVKDLNAVIEILDLYVVEPEIDLRVDSLSFHGLSCRPMAIPMCFLDKSVDDVDRDLLPYEIFEKYGGEGFWDLLEELDPYLVSSIQVFPYALLDSPLRTPYSVSNLEGMAVGTTQPVYKLVW